MTIRCLVCGVKVSLLLMTVIVAALAVQPLLAVFQSQASNNSSITGRVLDEDRQPVPDLWIELLDEVDSMIARTRTDRTGRYAFYRLSTGTFQVRVVTSGTRFAGQTQRVTLVPIFQSVGTRSVNEQVDFALRSASGEAPDPAAAGLVFAQEVPEAARRAYGEGVSSLEGGDVEGGLAGLKQALELFPTYYMALERIGLEYVRLGRYEPAMPLLSKAVEVNPKGQGSLYGLGVAQYWLKKYPDSADSLRRSLALAPGAANAPFIQYFLGLALMRDGKAREAEPQLEQAYRRGRTRIPPDVHMALAQIYSAEKRYREAIAELELYLKEAPDARDAPKIRSIIEQLRSKAR